MVIIKLLLFLAKLIFAGMLLNNRRNEVRLWCAACLLFAGLIEVSEYVGHAAGSSVYLAFAVQVLVFVRETGMPYAFLMAGVAYRDWPRFGARRLIGLLLLLPPAITAAMLHDGMLTSDNPFFLVWSSSYVLAAALFILGKNAFAYSLSVSRKEPQHRDKIVELVIFPVIFVSLLAHYWSEQIRSWSDAVLVILVLTFLLSSIGITSFGTAGSRRRLERSIAAGTLRNLTAGTTLMNRSLINRLTAIELAADRIAERTEETDPDVRLIRQETEHLYEMIEKIQLRSVPVELDKHTYSLNELIRTSVEACSDYHSEKKAAIRFRPDVHAVIRCDKSHLMEVFVSLLHNALDALPVRGGTIEIRLERTGRHLRLEFADNGHGIAPELMPKLGEPYFSTRTEPHHFGLGLTYSKLVLEKHNGTLKLVSQPGQGTKAIVRLPMKRVAALAANS